MDERTLHTVLRAVTRAERILIVTGAGLSADSGLPTYRGLGGLYNGLTEEGLPIEAALSGPTLRRDPALCWKYLAELGRACRRAAPNAAHHAIAELQRRKPGCWVLTQNIDGFHRRAGSPVERLIEIHGDLEPLRCQGCGAPGGDWDALLDAPLPPRCGVCGDVIRPPVVLFEERLPEAALETLYREMQVGFELAISIGTTASFPYIVEPVLQVERAGGLTVEINPGVTALSGQVDIRMEGRALDIMSQLLGHTLSD
ncbi:NAD-dependent protein deacylase [Pseudomonas mangiferae]|uniref:protein acetyllysine N-acetyltransferase n=1 Tax=Pseudomonas mangiferae TaxID=2593654 RepID=A0A553H2L3_9PSED|nr:NAD-dependent protein deacylase [Pseudomonas mangiferae]TRX75991.1 NAD-dependent protein deacylase [Pseudomonas mangiferae]